ncbi:hypothetical protein [Paraburkholderia sp. JPY419]|uniref:hypothetical protein n=1 Tax=Paraburkholderia sp. JPY419 TaxID=667660 RepID=UPI003D21344A
MKDLLTFAIEAHGGLKRWKEFSEVSADLNVGGALWGLKGQQGFVGTSHVTASLHHQWASHSPFLEPAHRSSFKGERVAIETLDGHVVEARENTRASFAGHTLATPWDRIQLAYFAGYAMWTYLTSPFSLVTDGSESAEVEPWQENDETWRVLRVRVPKSITTHSTEQIFYFDDEGLLRRHDYDVDISAGSGAAHYVYDHKPFNGIIVPTKRRIHIRGEDGKPQMEPLLVSINLSNIKFS